MSKGRWNFYIDILMLVCMAALSGIGFLMKYVLLPGREAGAVYGRKVELTWLGLDRHAWGTIHLYLAFLLLGLLLLHLVLHWQVLVSMWQKYLPTGRARFWATVVFLLVCGALFLFPFFSQPRVIEADSPRRGAGHGHTRWERLAPPAGQVAVAAAS